MKLMRKIISLMPEKQRHKFIRSKILVGSGAPAHIIFKLAETKEELEQAFQVLHEAYVEQKYMDPHPSGMRVTPYHALPTTSVLIAKDTTTGKVVATISIVRNTALGLPLDKVFPMGKMKKKFRHLAEVSSLAIQKKYRVNPTDVFWPLLRYFYLYIRNVMRVDAYVIGVNPSWHDLYAGLLGFTKLEGFEAAEYGFVNNAPVAAYFVNVEEQRLLLHKFYSELPESSNFFRYCCDTRLNPEQYQFPNTRYYSVHNAVMTVEFFEHFLVRETGALSKLNDTEKRKLLQYYPRGDDAKKVLGADDFILKCSRTFKRFLTRFDAKLRHDGNYQNEIEIDVIDFSAAGLKVDCDFDLPEEFELRVAVGQFDSAYLKVGKRRQRGKMYGLEILECDQAWLEFIATMRMEFDLIPTPEQSEDLARRIVALPKHKKTA